MKNNVLLIIFIVIALLASAVAVYFGINYNKLSKKESLSETSNVEDVASSEVEQIKEVEKIIEKAIIPKFDPNKMKNKPSDIKYTNDIMYTTSGLLINIKSNGEISVGKNSFNVKVNGITGNVIDVCYAPLGDGANDGITFVTENGDIYFASEVLDSVVASKDLSVQKVQNVSNVCKVISVMSEKGDNSVSKKRITLVAIDTNGECYDIWYAAKGI